jgi:predicted acetyltransferase
MDKLALITPTKSHEQAALDYQQEHTNHHEFHLYGSSLFNEAVSYAAWLNQLQNNSSPDTVQWDWVVSSTFFAIRESDGRIVGMVDIRHTLNDFLRNYGGHIGYGVRPSERNKGYATQILMLALDYCRHLGLDRVMLSCDKANAASRNTITRCGGVLEREFLHTDGNMVQVFWITL